jgi:NAD(P)-dependent dehydrogenase (short-subunit alcohol dehydrogenase family)
MADQTGRVVVITGANTGIGFETAAGLAEKGARVVLAVRSPDKGHAAATRITDRIPAAEVEVQGLDLASLESVRRAADRITVAHPRIDLLINNAGVMFTPRETTADGFELQFATNHLGHFAFTGLLLNQLLSVSNSRVVTLSSVAHRMNAAIHFDDLHWEQSYDPVAAYSQSKLANLMFVYELQRRLSSTSADTISVAAHPGAVDTELFRFSPALAEHVGSFQSAAEGARSTLRAATDPNVQGGQYYGPDSPDELEGNPTVVQSSPLSHDEEIQRRLWKVSEELTGVTYPASSVECARL